MLGAYSHSSPQEFRKAYLKLVRFIHPDKTSEPKAETAFKAMDGCYKDVRAAEGWDN